MKGKTILCTIDFSDFSQQALRWAITKAKQQKVHLTILYTYRLNQLKKTGEALEMKKKIEEEAVRDFAILENDLLKGEEISYDFRTEIGFVADRIEAYTKKNAVSYLVMDKNINKGNRETLDELMGQTKIPFVVIP